MTKIADMPKCTAGKRHRWRYDVSVNGNTGHGGVIAIDECRRCGLTRRTDTGATDHRGLRAVTVEYHEPYEA